MRLTWWGTSGFEIRTGETVILVDPYLTRNQDAFPVQPYKPGEIQTGHRIFISHGHFDHIFDVPLIATRTRAAVYCDLTAGETLVREGLNPNRIETVLSSGTKFDFNTWSARAYHSNHVRFDIGLVLKTLAKVGRKVVHLWPLVQKFPAGQVLSWRFDIEGRVIHHFGSAGSSRAELERFANMRTDILLVPLQGHSRIVDLALDYVEVMKPGLVIPHHYDDFYPPLSQYVDFKPFIDGVKNRSPRTEAMVLGVNETVDL